MEGSGTSSVGNETSGGVRMTRDEFVGSFEGFNLMSGQGGVRRDSRYGRWWLEAGRTMVPI